MVTTNCHLFSTCNRCITVATLKNRHLFSNNLICSSNASKSSFSSTVGFYWNSMECKELIVRIKLKYLRESHIQFLHKNDKLPSVSSDIFPHEILLILCILQIIVEIAIPF
jgi:hypothetical protein